MVPTRIAACCILPFCNLIFLLLTMLVIWLDHIAAAETERIITAVSKIRKSKDIGTSKTSSLQRRRAWVISSIYKSLGWDGIAEYSKSALNGLDMS